jgi:hypothetical protein
MKTNNLLLAILLTILLSSCQGRIWEKKLSDNVSVHVFENDKCKVYNDWLREYTTPLLDGVDYVDATDSTAAFCVDGLCGIIDVKTGKIIIDAQYRGTWVLSEGLIAVQNDSNKIGFINIKNELVIPFIFDRDVEQTKFGSSFYRFKNGYCVMGNGSGKFGFIDKKGNWVIKPQYDILSHSQLGYFIIGKGNKCGVLSPKLKSIIPVQYDNIRINAADTSFHVINDGFMYRVSNQGVIDDTFMADKVERLIYTDELDHGEAEKDYSWQYVKFEIDGLWGIYDMELNRPILPAKYDSLRLITHDILETYDKESKVVSLISLYEIKYKNGFLEE